MRIFRITMLQALALITAGVVTLLLGQLAPALAAGYPDQPIKLDVMYPPGGATDFQARIVTMLASKYLGQPVVIVNKPGAGGQVGWNEFVTQTKPDGYELGAYNVPSFIAQSLRFKTHYNVNNMEPIANWGADPAVLVVPKDSPFNNVKQFVAYAKAHPNKITVSGAGLYTGHQIATLQLEAAAHIKLNYVPAQGGVPALQWVMGHKVKAGFNNLSDAYRNRDRLKILAVADLERDKQFLPNVPTFKELGYNVDNTSDNYRGVMAPKGTPKQVIDYLAGRMVKMFKDPKVAAKMKQGGSPMHIMTRDQVIKMWHQRQKTLKAMFKNM